MDFFEDLFEFFYVGLGLGEFFDIYVLEFFGYGEFVFVGVEVLVVFGI